MKQEGEKSQHQVAINNLHTHAVQSKRILELIPAPRGGEIRCLLFTVELGQLGGDGLGG